MENIYFDSEFTGLHKKTTLISIGFISLSGKTFYAELTDFDRSQCDGWIQENVLTKLTLGGKPFSDIKDCSKYVVCGTKGVVSFWLSSWLLQFDSVKMISDCLAYDWVLLCDLFGGAMNLPSNVNYIPTELSTLLEAKGIDPDINREKYAYGENTEKVANKHNALWDAKVIKDCHVKVTQSGLNINT